ncbi:MAG: response regulator [Devosiaceae bacterium]|nr:response regulator [Devosiaceae bacterium MH13]
MANAEPHSIRSILVIDDDLADFMFFERSIGHIAPGVAIHHEQDGRRARDRISATDADLVILDLKMPGYSGYEVLEELKGAPDDADRVSIPVIVMSSSNDPRDIERCYKQHANAYVEKPATSADYKNLATSLRDFWIEQARLPH